MYLMMDIEISCKGHCESFSHFLYLVSYTHAVQSLRQLRKGEIGSPPFFSTAFRKWHQKTIQKYTFTFISLSKTKRSLYYILHG